MPKGVRRYRFLRVVGRGGKMRWAVLLIFTVSGCASNPFTKYYKDLLGGKPMSQFPLLIPHEGQPELVFGTEERADFQLMKEKGYAPIGYSAFNGPAPSPDDAVAQGRSVKAEVVLFYSQYTHTVSGMSQFSVQNPNQVSTINHQGNFFGSNGSSAFYNGTSTITSPGGFTTYQVPYRIDRFDSSAGYWVRVKPSSLGVQVADLTEEVRQRVRTSHGVLVEVVRIGSPAHKADLLRGDVIRRVGQNSIVDGPSFVAAIKKYEGQNVDIEFLRDGRARLVTVELLRVSPEVGTK
jgi:PDZ domain